MTMLRTVRLFVVLVAITMNKVVEASGKPHSTVQILDNTNFDEAINDPANGLWLLKFYAPWCGHCKKMAPMLDAIATYLEGKLAIGKIDCTTNDGKPVCNRFNVKGYPTLKIYRDGDYFDYPGNRDADSIIDFAEKMSEKAVDFVHGGYEGAISSVATKNNIGVAFLAYDGGAATKKSSGEEDVELILSRTKALQVFGQVARKMQAQASFGLIHPNVSREELETFGIDENGDRPYLIKVESGVPTKVYSGDMTSPDFLDFVKANNIALITKLDANNFRSTGNRGKPLVIGAVNPDNTEKTDQFLIDLKTYVQNAPENITGSYYFCQINGKKWNTFLKQFNVTVDALPEVFVLDVPNRTYWKSEMSSDISTLMDAVMSGEIKPKKQGDGAGGGMLHDLGQWFVKYLPWTAMGVFALFASCLILFLPTEKDQEPNDKAKRDALPSVPTPEKDEQTKKDD